MLDKDRGGGVVKAFPLDVAGTERPSYAGCVKMYKREGFTEIARLGKNTVLMHRIIDASEA